MQVNFKNPILGADVYTFMKMNNKPSIPRMYVVVSMLIVCGKTFVMSRWILYISIDTITSRQISYRCIDRYQHQHHKSF